MKKIKIFVTCICMHAKLFQFCLTLWGPTDYSLSGPSVCGILKARILEWVAMPSSRGSFRPRDETCVFLCPASQADSLPLSHREAHVQINSMPAAAAAAAKSLQSCSTLCDPRDGSPPGSPSLGFSRQEHWSGLPFPSPMHENEKWKWSRSVVSGS